MLVISRLYKEMHETFYYIYPPEIRINTVHAYDVIRAMVHLAQWYQEQNKTGTVIYNLSDTGDSSIFDG